MAAAWPYVQDTLRDGIEYYKATSEDKWKDIAWRLNKYDTHLANWRRGDSRPAIQREVWQFLNAQYPAGIPGIWVPPAAVPAVAVPAPIVLPAAVVLQLVPAAGPPPALPPDDEEDDSDFILDDDDPSSESDVEEEEANEHGLTTDEGANDETSDGEEESIDQIHFELRSQDDDEDKNRQKERKEGEKELLDHNRPEQSEDEDEEPQGGEEEGEKEPQGGGAPESCAKQRTVSTTQRDSKEQADFRIRMFQAYQCCVISECQLEEAVEAAHILPWKDWGYGNDNGLLLRKDLHRLFDKFLWSFRQVGFTTTYVVHLHPRMAKERTYASYAGIEVSLPLANPQKLGQHFAAFEATLANVV